MDRWIKDSVRKTVLHDYRLNSIVISIKMSFLITFHVVHFGSFLMIYFIRNGYSDSWLVG